MHKQTNSIVFYFCLHNECTVGTSEWNSWTKEIRAIAIDRYENRKSISTNDCICHVSSVQFKVPCYLFSLNVSTIHTHSLCRHFRFRFFSLAMLTSVLFCHIKTSICLPCFTTHIKCFHFVSFKELKEAPTSGPKVFIENRELLHIFKESSFIFSFYALSISNKMLCLPNKYHSVAILCHPYDSQFQCDGIFFYKRTEKFGITSWN